MSNLEVHYSAPGQTGCFQRVKFPPRQEVQLPHRESSLGSEEVGSVVGRSHELSLVERTREGYFALSTLISALRRNKGR